MTDRLLQFLRRPRRKRLVQEPHGTGLTLRLTDALPPDECGSVLRGDFRPSDAVDGTAPIDDPDNREQ
jgi:hypothetical protein